MKYTIHGFSQATAIKLEIDERDLMILRWFVDYKDGGKMIKKVMDNETFYWIDYKGITDAFPIASWKKDTVYRRLKKMVDRKILKHKTLKQGGIWSYYTLGENYAPLLDTENEITPFGKKSEGIGKKSEGIGKKSEGIGKKSGTKNSSINNSSINNSSINQSKRKTYCTEEDPKIVDGLIEDLKQYTLGSYEDREYKRFLNAGYGDVELIKDVYDNVMLRAKDPEKKPIKNLINYLATAIRKEFKSI